MFSAGILVATSLAPWSGELDPVALEKVQVHRGGMGPVVRPEADEPPRGGVESSVESVPGQPRPRRAVPGGDARKARRQRAISDLLERSARAGSRPDAPEEAPYVYDLSPAQVDAMISGMREGFDAELRRQQEEDES